jgi:hypothetical protein
MDRSGESLQKRAEVDAGRAVEEDNEKMDRERGLGSEAAEESEKTERENSSDEGEKITGGGGFEPPQDENRRRKVGKAKLNNIPLVIYQDVTHEVKHIGQAI